MVGHLRLLGALPPHTHPHTRNVSFIHFRRTVDFVVKIRLVFVGLAGTYSH